MARWNSEPWREYYGVLHFKQNVLGMCYVSARIDRDWGFGNYFGVVESARWSNSKRFLQACVSRVASAIPTVKGILFEIEVVDFQLLSGTTRSATPSGAFKAALTAARRLKIYQAGGARAVLDADGSPLPYWQPPMDKCSEAQRDLPLHLMVYRFPSSASQPFDLNEALAFIYDDLYLDAYGDHKTIGINGFSSRVGQIKERVLEAATAGWSLGEIAIPRPVRNALLRHHGDL